ncbi:hypothetical protein RO21_10550 [[Actinobacillus] muris]|uniref:Uncharacterized protein n=1 Tax=Muribacter muris TaxID=67855 RepID=A0A0J5P295_9PAST|nr:hypothetical protein [Muribacter muris]KMK50658.1 hypothetical protein RO21_10550 [[Actinobacillus] muris] [Muribacter muris]
MEIIFAIFAFVYVGAVAAVFFALQFMLESVPTLLAAVVACVFTASILSLLIWLVQPLKHWLTPYKRYIKNGWQVFFYLFIFPPLAVILGGVCLLPFALIVGLTDSIMVGIFAFVIVSALILFSRYHQIQNRG